ncbi:outer membrane protein/protective antigen OMA87 [Rubidibacter lacunae KORDI 51-2]|uniref:Outer membrane protein/protective antigen OMA87 n=1 Tax=Rubidibacter lacunae KORDI 51-2 TaxID=582515 RepID=U5DN94_9CHRO|nr:BamA/TamA family outer membrane protein [Rubidibacter lacunae]ERN42337.1 outer membrane protein/protective antigen OMA87 [Rubidibacter lacunae KORDI 51-2]
MVKQINLARVGLLWAAIAAIPLSAAAPASAKEFYEKLSPEEDALTRALITGSVLGTPLVARAEEIAQGTDTDPPESTPPDNVPDAPAEDPAATESEADVADDEDVDNEDADEAPPVSQPQPVAEPRVLVAEVLVEGVDGELQDLVYATTRVAPGRVTTRSQLQADVNAIFGTGVFSNVRVQPVDTPLGVRITFIVEANPVLREVVVETLPRSQDERVLPQEVVNEIFSDEYGETLNLRILQDDIDDLNAWYQENGYDLAQVVDDPEVSEDGIVTLTVAEGVIADIRVQFFDEDGAPDDGRTRDFIVTREIQLQPGDVYNRDTAQEDLERVFGLGLFDDARLSFQPGDDPATAIVTVELVEGNSGSLAAGVGISSSTGVFGTVSYQEQNIGGNNQDLGVEFQVGERDLLFDFSFRDPWIGGDNHRTSYRLNAFRRRSISVIFDNGETDVDLPNGDTPRVRRTGGGVNFSRPLISDPFDESDWRLSAGFDYQRVSIRDSDGDLTPRDELGNLLSFDESGRDDLFTLSFSAARDKRDDSLDPTSGSFLSLRFEQTLPIGSGSILSSRLRANYSFYIPVNFLRFSDGPQAFAFNVQAGTHVGDLPPYEAFALGGIDSVRGYERGGVGSGKSFAQASVEYRFPIFNILSGVLFFDYATDIGTGKDVPGNPAGARDKPGDGFGYGGGVRVRSPLGALRLDVGVNDDGDTRVHFGIGQRF